MSLPVPDTLAEALDADMAERGVGPAVSPESS